MVKTRIFIPKDSWDQENQRIRVPKIRVMSPEKMAAVKELEEQNGRLKELSQFIMSSFLESGAGKKEIPSDWLTGVLTKFYKDDDKEEVVEEKETLVLSYYYFLFLESFFISDMYLKRLNSIKRTDILSSVYLVPRSFRKRLSRNARKYGKV